LIFVTIILATVVEMFVLLAELCQ